MKAITCLLVAEVVVVLASQCLGSDAGWACEINIRKDATNVVISYDGLTRTNDVSRNWYYAIAPKARVADILSITVTLGDLRFEDAAEAIQQVVKPWRGRVALHMTSIRQDGACITMTTYVQDGNDIRAHISLPRFSVDQPLGMRNETNSPANGVTTNMALKARGKSEP